MKVYAMFSRKPLAEVYGSLKDMGVNYFLHHAGSCSKPTK